MTDTTGRLVGAGAGVGVGVGVLALALAVGIYLESGRNGRIARAIAFFRRVSITTGKWLTFVDLLL